MRRVEHGQGSGRSCVFFFSSRRRHTRFDCDWSSDVCSSDLPLRERLVGCVALDEVSDPHELDEDERAKVLVEAGKLIDEETAQAIEDAGIEAVRIRSVLTCEAKRGVCRMCYGRNLATMDMVDLGEDRKSVV